MSSYKSLSNSLSAAIDTQNEQEVADVLSSAQLEFEEHGTISADEYCDLVADARLAGYDYV